MSTGSDLRRVPVRSPLFQVVAVFGGFLLGPWAALQTGVHLAPESDLVHTASVFAFVLVFVGGTLFWGGRGMAQLIATGAWRRAHAPRAEAPVGVVVPPGYGAYVWLGCVAGVAVGLLAAAATELTAMEGILAWTALGALYGWLLRTAAHHGYLPFREPG
jgi:hypothetical protein